MNEYRYKEEWLKREKDFSISIHRWKHIGSNENIWNVYVHICPEHAMFDELQEEYDCKNIEFHGGCTYVKWHRDENGKVTDKNYGCDYNHYGDDYFNDCEKLEDAHELLADVKEIMAVLKGVV